MSTTARTAHFGRHTSRSVYQSSLDFFTSKTPSRHGYPSQFTSQQSSPFSSATSRAHTSKRPSSWNFPRPPKAYNSQTRRSITSGGLLLAGFTTNSSPSASAVANCAVTVAESAATNGSGSRVRIIELARSGWQRNIHTGRIQSSATLTRRKKSTKTNDNAKKYDVPTPKTRNEESSGIQETPSTNKHTTPSLSDYFHLPHLPHRPSKEEFLAAANGFWQRLRVRFKWFSIRSMRPWNIDEWGAFVSWFLFGHLVWILVGTTTFFSLIILSINTVFAQETLASWIGDYLTKSAGLQVVFESAIVPKWKDGVISFKNVFVSRRPGQLKSSVSKGSSSNAAAVAAAGRTSEGQVDEEDDGNYTQFDVTINTVNVTLSFLNWWNSKGLLKDVEVKGVRGVVDRTNVRYTNVPVDPKTYRHEHQEGDFEIESYKLEDLLVTVHQPGGFRPFSVSIYSCELPKLRKQWLFYDFLSANHMSGSFDGSLFTIHPRQVHGVPAGQEHTATDNIGEPEAWKKFSRLRIDGLRIDHLNRAVEGPFGWIYEGNVDIVSDIMLPNDDDDSIIDLMSDFYDQMEAAVTSNRYLRALNKNVHGDYEANNPGYAIIRDAGSMDSTQAAATASEIPAIVPSPPLEEEPPRYVLMDVRVHLNDVKAAVPLFTSDMSYVNQALVRPIVAYINAKKTYIPMSCRIVKHHSDFDGSWTIFDSGLMDDLSAEMYAAFARDVEDQQTAARRLKKVGFWTLSLAVHALFMGLAGNVI